MLNSKKNQFGRQCVNSYCSVEYNENKEPCKSCKHNKQIINTLFESDDENVDNLMNMFGMNKRED